MIKKNSIIIAVVILIIVFGIGLVLSHTHTSKNQRFGGTTNLDSLGVNSITDTGTGYFGQGISEGGLDSINTGSTTVNLGSTDIATTSVISITASSAATTVNLPASSSLSNILVNPGDLTWVIIQSASTTGGTITLVGGTGNTLQKATSSAVIAAGGSAILKIYRKPNGLDFNTILVGLAN
jgi:hypothetical protein